MEEKDIEIKVLMQIQELLNLTESSLDNISTLFIESIWSLGKSIFSKVIENIILSTIYRPYSNGLLVEFLKVSTKNMKELNDFKIELIQSFLKKLDCRAYKPYSSALCMFLCTTVLKDFINLSAILTEIQKYENDNEKFEQISFFIFVWLAPEIEQTDKIFYNNCISIIEKMRFQENHYPTVARFLYDFENLRNDNWKALKQRRASDNTLKIFSAILKRDGIEELIQLSFHPQFNINQRIAQSIYEPSFFVSYNPTLIEFSAYCGSIKCFNFLLENDADIELTDNNNKTFNEFVIVGNNKEIIEICKKKFENINFDSYKYLLTEFHYDFNDISEKSFLAACKSNSLKVIQNCLNNKININCCDEKLKTPIIYATEFDHIEVIKLLLLDENINVNCRDVDGMTPLQYACQNGYYEIVKLFLTLDKIDLNIGNKFDVFSYVL